MSDSARKPGSDGTRVIAPSATAEAVPPPIPDHELVRCIGRGSYGDVWLARNIMGTWRAVKVVYRKNFENERPYEREFGGIKKFEPVSRSHESQVNILHVGRHDSLGCFYYIMELADDANAAAAPGDAIAIDPRTYEAHTLKTELTRRGRLGFEQCVRLGLSLCTALEHLHRHGLIHRDIKPGNIIFVNGIPKLADIGLVTETGNAQTFVGTEGYLPPEGPGTVRGDIYSLGKVLYEMATGRDRTEYPELPTLLGQMSDREELLELNEVIVKACASDPEKRYQVAGQIHADLLLLRTGKSVKHAHWLERRLALVSKVGAAVTAISILAAVAFIYRDRQAQRAEENYRQSEVLRKQTERERQRADEQAAIAKAVSDFLQTDLLRQADSRQQASRGNQPEPELTVKEALNRASRGIGARFQEQPLVEAAIRMAIGEAYHGIGEAEHAIPHLKRSAELRQQHLGPDHPDTLTTINYLTYAYWNAGRLAEALPLMEETLKLSQSKLGAKHPGTLHTMNNLAMAYQDVDRMAEALPLYEGALKLRQANLGPSHLDTLDSMGNLAQAYQAADRLAEALPLHEEALKLRKANLGPNHPDSLLSMGNLAQAYQAAGRLAEALPLHEETLKLMKAKLGPDHPKTLTSMNNLAGAYEANKQPSEAEVVYRECLALYEKHHPDDWHRFGVATGLGGNLLKQKKLEEAEPLLLAGYAGLKEHETQNHAVSRTCLRNALLGLVSLYKAQGQPDKMAEWKTKLSELDKNATGKKALSTQTQGK